MPYTRIDHVLARRRFHAAYPHVRPSSRVCDLGCGLEAGFLNYAADRIAYGVGLDYQVEDGTGDRWQRVRADIRKPLPLQSGEFDHVVMLAVLEHLTEPEGVLREAHRILNREGSLILTWPSGIVDPLLHALHSLRLVSGEMESDEHQKRIPPSHLQQMLHRMGFHRFLHRRFEFGVNNLLVASR